MLAGILRAAYVQDIVGCLDYAVLGITLSPEKETAELAGRGRLGRTALREVAQTGIHAVDVQARALHAAALGALLTRRGPAS